MPRRNRQKLHRELRLRAEARKAERRARRIRARAQAVTVRQTAEQALARRATRVRAVAARMLPAVRSEVEHLLQLAHVGPELRMRVDQLLELVADQIPELARSSHLPWLVLLAQPHWVRRVDTFVAPSGSLRRKRDALAAHLLVRYRAPAFLFRALDQMPLAVARVPVEDEWAVALLAAVGQGMSVRSLVGTPTLPVPLTRRMCHLLLAAPASVGPVDALRHAQVAGLGGPQELARKLVRTRLGTLRGADPQVGEPFWHQVIAWMSGRAELAQLPDATLGHVLAWIEAEQRAALAAGRPFSLQGRTVASVTRDAMAWHAQEQRQDEDFPRSGLLSWRGGSVAVDEICSRKALQAEAEEMRHCAASYWRLAKRGAVALFSMQFGGRRVATIEVSLGAMRVVLAKQACNQAITSVQREVLTRWAARNRLAVAEAL